MESAFEMHSEFGSCVSLISCCQIHLGEKEEEGERGMEGREEGEARRE